MQLKGPPRLNDWLAPYCSFQTPMQAAFQPDDQVERYQKNRVGLYTRVGDPALRGQFTLEWQGLTYDQAARILYELRTGHCELTPRTDVGGGGTIDLTGDGVPDLILQEVTLPCRVRGELPASTPVSNVLTNGEDAASIQVELETLGTFSEIPGFTTPTTLTVLVSPISSGAEWALEVDFGANTEIYVDWGDGTSSSGTRPQHVYASDGGPFTVSMAILSNTIPVMDFNAPGFDAGRSRTNVDLTNTDFGDLRTSSFRPGGGGVQAIGQPLMSAPAGITSWSTNFKFTGSHDATVVPRTTEYITTRRLSGDVMNLPKDMIDIRLFQGTADQIVISAGGPVGSSTTYLELQGYALSEDFQSETIDNNGEAPNIEILNVQQGARTYAFMNTMRKLRAVLSGNDVDLSSNVPSTMERIQANNTRLVAPPLAGVENISKNLELLCGNFYGRGGALSIENGEPQMTLLWQDLYNVRNSLSATLTLNLRQEYFGTAYCTAGVGSTTADDLWKMVGYRSYKGDSVLDKVQSLSLKNLVQRDITRISDTQFEVSWSLPAESTQPFVPSNTSPVSTFAYEDSTSTPRAFVRDGFDENYIDIFTAGEQVRLQGVASDALVEVASATYDIGAEKLVVDIDPSPQLSSSTGSIPSDADRMTYAFFFTSTA